jgi:hypothetical protein
MTVRVRSGTVEGKRIGRGHACGSFPESGRSEVKENNAAAASTYRWVLGAGFPDPPCQDH